VHWVVFNIAITSKINENSIPGKQGINDSKVLNYDGPCPPSGSHRYVFKLFALDQALDLKEGISKEELLRAMKGHILDKTKLIGIYSRDKRK